jgi:Protein of unknown function (DUF1344)
MKKVLGLVVAILIAVSAVGAWAEEIQGKVQKVDFTDRMIILEDGTQLWVAEGVPIGSLKEGATVKASYEEREGKKVATSLEVSD